VYFHSNVTGAIYCFFFVDDGHERGVVNDINFKIQLHFCERHRMVHVVRSKLIKDLKIKLTFALTAE
jgi:hypothetical protein